MVVREPAIAYAVHCLPLYDQLELTLQLLQQDDWPEFDDEPPPAQCCPLPPARAALNLAPVSCGRPSRRTAWLEQRHHAVKRCDRRRTGERAFADLVSSAGTRVIHLLMAWLVYCAILIIQQPLDKAGWSYRAHRPQGNPPAGSGDLGGQRIERADLMSQAGRQLAQGRDGIRPRSSAAPWLPRWG